MPYSTDWNFSHIEDQTLAIFVLNVGHGDAIIIRFPKINGEVLCSVVDCYKFDKAREALSSLGATRIAFMCATHPHLDHILGFQNLIKWCGDNNIPIDQFWDCGFRHISLTHYNLIRALQNRPLTAFLRLTSGFEVTHNSVRVQALAPSIRLKNKYDTFGTNINNGSIVLKLDYPAADAAKYYQTPDVLTDEELAEEEKIKQNTMILGGDAQFDSWAHLVQEFPQQTRYAGKNRGQLIERDSGWTRITHKPLRAQVLKVPHHMSKNGISYEVMNNIHSKYVLVSCSDSNQHTCPHPLTVDAAAEVSNCETYYTGHTNPDLCSGTLAVLFKGNGATPKIYGLGESSDDDAPI